MLGRTRLVAIGRACVARARTRAKLALDCWAVRWLKSGMHSAEEDGSEEGKWPAVKKGCWRMVWRVGRSSANGEGARTSDMSHQVTGERVERTGVDGEDVLDEVAGFGRYRLLGRKVVLVVADAPGEREIESASGTRSSLRISDAFWDTLVDGLDLLRLEGRLADDEGVPAR